MSLCVACVAAEEPSESTVVVLGTEYCSVHGVAAWQTSLDPRTRRRLGSPPASFGMAPQAPQG